MKAIHGAASGWKPRAATLLSAALIVGFARDAQARRERVRHIPNGNDYTCDSCHGKASLLRQDLTSFGRDADDAISGGVVQWSQLYHQDSDGDGFTNGEELNDPGGEWRRGQPDPGGATENPGIAQTYICGNGTLEPGEECDGSQLFGASCESLGLGDGVLACGRCQYNTSGCGRCGDGILHADREDCDQRDFGETTCASFGFLQGMLTCDATCEIDSTDCNSEAPAVCGDAIISRGELCDQTNFAGVDCERLNYAGGVLVCDASCQWDATRCIPKDYAPIDRPGVDVGEVTPEEDQPPEGGTGYNYDALGAGDGGGCAQAGSDLVVIWPLVMAVAMVFVRKR